jgi:hypothetical protein
LSEGVSPTLHRKVRLQVDLPVCGGRAYNGRELLSLSIRDGQWVPADFPRSAHRSLSQSSPARRVLDGAPSHRSEEIVCPGNISFLHLPAYSPELDPVERWFQEFRRELSNKAFETVELLQEALGQALGLYWEAPGRLQQLTGFSWWVEAVDAL